MAQKKITTILDYETGHVYVVFFHSREDIQKAVSKFIDWVNTVPQTVIDRLCL